MARDGRDVLLLQLDGDEPDALTGLEDEDPLTDRTDRADRHPRPRTFLPSRAIRPEDAWCEDPYSRHYNQPLRLDRDHGGDRLTRDDHLYDFIVEIDHNTSPRIAGLGSAVFLHLARENFGPTAGCVSMTKSAMLQLLKRLGPQTRIVIG